ncbi:hypothetical protein Cgig2_010874 [Carnegiea gigantea]|uniref:Uncharacterized protein n=1 Tax=Carnegiea gigantea TaxID=171969 RepID=A0A9Q1GTT1_9CARY|nr:hypothetical protein Cgig2_010874 [Carnegiea gigantea]
MKRSTATGTMDIEAREDVIMRETELESPNVPESACLNADLLGVNRQISYRDTSNVTIRISTLQPGRIQFERRMGLERPVQPGRNPGSGKERGAITGDNHGSRFRALENLDLNVELEIGMEGEDLLCDKEDTSHTLENWEVDGSQNEAVILEHNSEQVMEHIVGKENIPQSTLRQT